MKLNYGFLYRGVMAVFAALLLWSLWASAAPTPAATRPNALVESTNTAAGVLTNAVAQDRSTLLTFGLDRLEPFEKHVFGIPLWQYLASLIYIFLAFFVSKFLDLFIGVQMKKWAARTETTLDELLLDLIHGPVKIVSLVILLHIGLRVFDWPEWIEQWLSKGLQVVVAGSLTYMALKMIDLAMGYWQGKSTGREDKAFDEQLFPIIRKSLKVFAVVVAALVTSQNLGLNITGVIASLSIGGLALGLAAQDTLSNLFGAVAVFIDKPFRIGDRIQIDTVDGTVEAIGLRSTRVRNLDGFLVTIPNKTMGSATITNVSGRPTIKNLMNIGITYDTPVEKIKRAIQIIDDVFRPHPMTADLLIGFNKFENSSLNILVVHWWKGTDVKASLAGLQEMNLTLKQRFDAEQINFAFPTQTLYLKQDSIWRLDHSSDTSKG